MSVLSFVNGDIFRCHVSWVINEYLAHRSLTALKWVKRGLYCCFDIWGLYVMTSFLLWLVHSCEFVCHTFPRLYLCWIFALSWGEKKKKPQIPKTTPHHTVMKIKVKKWRMARHPRCVFKSPENSAPGDSPCFLPERAFPFRVEKTGASLSVADGELEWRFGVLSPCLTQGTWSLFILTLAQDSDKTTGELWGAWGKGKGCVHLVLECKLDYAFFIRSQEQRSLCV